MADLCVVHLVREANGPEPLRAFLASYGAREAGVAHDLLLLFKGFEGGRLAPEYASLLGGLAHLALHVPDEGFDIVPYFRAARETDSTHLFFLNSFSEILDDGWLAKPYEHARRDGVGVVGATGSWESIYAGFMREWDRSLRPLAHPRTWLRHQRETLRTALRLRREFPRFPNPHVRTNAFLIARRVMLAVNLPEVRDKHDAHRFESGREGMTRQVVAMGLKPLVVGRDGRAYGPGEWAESFTFRRGGQHNLRVSDNQTRHYEAAGAAERRRLEESAWGRVRPARPEA